jgi:hypothetical protein
MYRSLKALPLILLLMIVAIITTSCGSTTPAQVRFVNAIPDTAQYGTALDVEFNQTKIFTAVPFFGYMPSTSYTKVSSGTDTVEGLATGTTNEIFMTNLTFNIGSEYTMVATGFATNISHVAVISALDNNNTPASGHVEFRAIDASPSGPAAVDVYIVPVGSGGTLTPPATITNLAYRGTSKYITLNYNPNMVNGANYTMFVTATGTTTPILLTQSLSAGSSSGSAIRTVIFTDQENMNQLNPLAMVLSDLN